MFIPFDSSDLESPGLDLKAEFAGYLKLISKEILKHRDMLTFEVLGTPKPSSLTFRGRPRDGFLVALGGYYGSYETSERAVERELHRILGEAEVDYVQDLQVITYRDW